MERKNSIGLVKDSSHFTLYTLRFTLHALRSLFCSLRSALCSMLYAFFAVSVEAADKLVVKDSGYQ